MGKLVNNMYELIGDTPLLRLNIIEKANNLYGKLYAKLEYLNATGSIKDRAALQMILDAEEKGLLKKGSTIIEPTSGNTGIALAAIGVSRGYRVIIVMPDSFSIERRKLIKAYGAEIVLSEGKLGMKGAVDKAYELQKNISNSYIPSQFDNESNYKAHYLSTGKEIYEALNGNVDILVAGIGTGGTITGIGKYLKEKNKDIQIIGVEPASSPLLTKGNAGPHKIQGIGANFIPKILDTNIYDEIYDVEDLDAINCAKSFNQSQGVLVGISSGAALYVGIKLAERKENKDKNIVVILPDSGDRYLSTELFGD